jgi:hypothetical protein
MAKQIKYRRGTTTQHAVFTGVQGELTVDTVRNVVIVHDGATPGGWPAANATAVAAQISVLTANNAFRSANIVALQSNAAVQANLITALQSNAATQQASINAFILSSNATLINQQFAAVNANVTAANAAIESLITANLIQGEDIDELRVSISATNANVTAANAAINGFVVGTGFATIGQLTANITAVNANAAGQSVEISGLRANITAANAAIVSINANVDALAANIVSLTVITPDDIEINNVATLVFTGNGVTTSSAGDAVTLDIPGGSGIDLESISSNVSPSANATYNLGTTTRNWKNLYLSGNVATARAITPEVEGTNDTLAIYSNWAKDTGISIVSQANTTSSVTLTSNDIVGVVTGVGATQQEWVFEANGAIVFPDNSVQTTAWSGTTNNAGNFIFTGNDAALPPNYAMTLSTYQALGNKESRLTLSTSGISKLDAGNNFRISVGYGTGFEKYWTFGADGSVTWPDASVQLTGSPTTANLINGSYTVSLGSNGRLTLPISDQSVSSIESASGIWLSANGKQLQLNSNGAIDIPLVGGTTGLIRTSANTTVNSNGKEWLFSQTGSLTVPGIIVHPTVDKNNNSSLLITANVTPTFNANWSAGTYNFTFSGSGAGYVVVDGSNNAGVTIDTAGTALWTTGETIAVIDGSTLGGTTGTDDITITVATRGPTNIDLTKTVNKLVEGGYFLGDGVEGQIMYLVSHPSVTTPASVSVSVYASRDSIGAYTYRTLTPFTANSGVCTLLYTAASWQSVSGGTFT